MGHTIAIDLGTCNTSVAVLEHDQPQVLYTSEGARVTPAFVAFVDGERVLVGAAAKRQAIMNPRQTVYGLKGLVGRRYESPEVQRLQQQLSFELVPSGTGDVRVRVGDREYDPEEIQSVLLHRMRRMAEQYLDAEIAGAYLTVPAHFNAAQRNKTREAAKRAGLKVRGLLSEATAAAVWAGSHRRRVRHVAVVDVGGTLDVTILGGEAGTLQTRAARHDPTLGGEAFDWRIVKRLYELLRVCHDLDVKGDAVALQRLRDAAERAKQALSEQEAVAISLPALGTGAADAIDLQHRLTRPELESLTQDLVDRIGEPCAAALRQAGVTPADVGELVVCGGMAHVPAVRARIEAVFEQPAVPLTSPEEAVVLGAVVLSHPMGGAGG
ncbi:MAG: Hsp70 family protein [Deltaproteobacteria bacterium]|nr:Hsp70 family protein [Deltaproteobacteria bacterium]